MKILIVLLMTVTTAGLHAQTAPDLGSLHKLAEGLRTFPKHATDKEQLNSLYQRVRGASDLLSDPSLCQKDIGVCEQSPAVRAAVKEVLTREVGPEGLTWWAENVDVIIARWANSQDGLANGLKKLNHELPPGMERPRWKVYLTNTALIVVGLPLMIAAEMGRGALDFSPSLLQSLIFDLTDGSAEKTDLRRAVNVLGFRKLIQEAYAETCPGSLGNTTR